MSSLKNFLSQNKIKSENIKFVASNSFVDDDKKPIEWEIRQMSNAEFEAIQKECTKKIPQRNGIFKQEIDAQAVAGKVASACTVFPNLKDAELQNSYGVMGEDELLKVMLSVGEYATYTQKIYEINGFNASQDDLVEEAKN